MGKVASMTDEQSPLVLPKAFEACPNCGSTRRFCEEALKGDISAKEMEDNKPVLLSGEFFHQNPLYVIKLQAIMDVCIDCGTLYAIALLKFKGVPSKMPGGDGHGRERLS